MLCIISENLYKFSWNQGIISMVSSLKLTKMILWAKIIQIQLNWQDGFPYYSIPSLWIQIRCRHNMTLLRIIVSTTCLQRVVHFSCPIVKYVNKQRYAQPWISLERKKERGKHNQWISIIAFVVCSWIPSSGSTKQKFLPGHQSSQPY